MQPQSPLVGPDRGVELHAEAIVHLYLSLVVHPGHPEEQLALRRHDPLQQRVPAVLLLIRLNHHAKGFQNFFDSLMELRLGGILGHYQLIDLINI